MLETIEELEVPNIDKDNLVPGRESDINNANKPKEDKKEPLIKEDKKDNEEKEETGEE